MSLHPWRAATRTLTSRCARLCGPALALLVLLPSAALAYLRRERLPRQHRLLHEGTWCRLELGLYHVMIVPLIAFLPAPMAYGIARLQGNWRFRLDRSKREYIMYGLESVLGDQLSPAERTRITRDYLRLSSCQAVDALRLAGKGRALARLVEIRGREHLEAALAAGKGAILCGAHFGSYDSCFSLIGSLGLPITAVGRRPTRLNKDWTFVERMVFRLFIQSFLARHKQQPNIQPRGQLESAVQAAQVLRQNEVLGILIDPPVLDVDRPRAVPVDFLNGQALLLPGVTTIAQLMGTPVLMTFMRRSADWRHQVLEISPPISMEDDALTAFRRCLAVVEAAILQNPAHWHYWGKYALMDLGLLPKEQEPA